MAEVLIYIPMLAFAGWFWWRVGVWLRQNGRMALNKGRHVKTRINNARNAFMKEEQ